MIISYYPYIIGIMEKLNELNEKLDQFSAKYLDNVWVGTAIIGVLLAVAYFAIGFFNKRQ